MCLSFESGRKAGDLGTECLAEGNQIWGAHPMEHLEKGLAAGMGDAGYTETR